MAPSGAGAAAAAGGEHAAAHPPSTCGCPGQCRLFEELPGDRGVMITLGVPSSPAAGLEGVDDSLLASHSFPTIPTASIVDSTRGSVQLDGEKESSSAGGCTCLQLHPQEDANLPQFHPNIYIPAALLDYPEELTKYGGGGSGVTVFGGYHPVLGSLVMKHGGHKDLIELVSLAKIEREMGVRGQWKIDNLQKGGCVEDNGGAKMSNTDHAVGAPAAHRQTKRKTVAVPELTSTVGDMIAAAEAAAGGNGYAKMKKGQKSQPLLNTMGSVMRRMGSAFNFASADNLSSSLRRRSVGRKSSHKSDIRQLEDSVREAEVQAIHAAIEDMRQRIPSFRMIYISPMHLRERAEELKNNTYLASRRTNSRGRSGNGMRTGSGTSMEMAKVPEGEETNSSSQPVTPQPKTGSPLAFSESKKLIRRHSSLMRNGRKIHLFGSPNTKAASIHIHSHNVDLCFGGSYRCCGCADDESENKEETSGNQTHSCRSRADGSDGYACLMAFVERLRHKQEENEWKVTLAQQTIGQVDDGNSAMTASSLLARGELHGPLLHHLIDSEVQVIRNLQILTTDEEVDAVESVRAEYESIMSLQKRSDQTVSAEEVSKTTNDFVGKAIHKNFHPTTGRFVMLRGFGRDLREGKIHLKPKEVIPAKHLECLFYECWEKYGIDVAGTGNREGAAIGGSTAFEDTFNMHYDPGHEADNGQPYHEHPIFDAGLDQWQSLLKLSLSMKHPNATNRIWTCGLTDGGLHNMFLSDEQQWLFDLGEPNLEPIPAFLTKFLMSFFHTLGMEEDDKGDWVVRFEQDDSGKLRLTERTNEIMPKVMEAFNVTMDRLINELFGGEEEIRVLLLRYVVTQLISDAAFCIDKWRQKGGGDESRSDHQYFLEKWLWRALWDVYASEEIRRRYLTRMLLRRQPKRRTVISFEDLGSLVEDE
ncbi:hypothetical protein ACHAXT_002707 [Thalassiosira profunda]